MQPQKLVLDVFGQIVLTEAPLPRSHAALRLKDSFLCCSSCTLLRALRATSMFLVNALLMVNI